MSDSSKQKPLSERRIGYGLAILGGTLGFPIGWVASPLALFILNKKLKHDGKKPPNRFLIWALIGIVGAPLCLFSFGQLVDESAVKQPGTVIESSTISKSKGQKLIAAHLVELDKMRNDSDFLLYGLSPAGPYGDWIKDFESEAKSLKLHVIESTAVGYLSGLARSYAIYKGIDNESTLRQRKNIVEVINWKQVDPDDSSKWPESWR